jgi:hypothetical protein
MNTPMAHCVPPTQQPLTPRSPRSERPPAAVSAPVRVFLIRYVATLGVMLGGAIALVVGWSMASTTEWVQGHLWLAACLATTGWALGVAAWLCRRIWRSAATVLAVTWATPATVLMPFTSLGWLSPGGLLLWGPVSAALAVVLGMALHPVVPALTSTTEAWLVSDEADRITGQGIASDDGWSAR